MKRFSYAYKCLVLLQPRDCVVGSSSSSDVLSSSNSCPNYISLPAYASLGKFPYYSYLIADVLYSSGLSIFLNYRFKFGLKCFDYVPITCCIDGFFICNEAKLCNPDPRDHTLGVHLLHTPLGIEPRATKSIPLHGAPHTLRTNFSVGVGRA